MKFIGILGFGKLGQFIYQQIEKSDEFQVSFVWNRSLSSLQGKISEELILSDISELKRRKCDLVIEVCHPDVVVEYAESILQLCDLMVGSPTVFANKTFKDNITKAANLHAIYVPTGAMWGLEDIIRLDECKEIKTLKITMEKHPNSFKLVGKYKELNDEAKLKDVLTILYNGPVGELSKIAPNNVNTMAVAALAANSLGFQEVVGSLISNPRNRESHIVTIELETIFGLKVITKRINPASVGAVTGSATFMSFYQSLRRATGANSGLHFC